MRSLIGIFYAIGSIFTITGFYKLWFYKNSEYPFNANINAYVGGDAYNYIINSGKATAYFTAALICIVLASSFLIIEKLESLMNNSKTVQTEAPKIDDTLEH